VRGTRFTKEQIIGMLEEAEARGSAADVSRRHVISAQMFCRWRHTYGGMDVSEARRLEDLERERANKRPKQLRAEQILDNQALKEMLKTSRKL
jgi:putative transposase